MKKNDIKDSSKDKSRYEILRGASSAVKDTITSGIIKRKVDHYSRNGSKGFFPIGLNGSYLFSYPTFSMIYVDKIIEEITGISQAELLAKPIYHSFSRIIIPEHVYASARLAETAFKELSSHPKEDVVICTEYNILTPGQESKRLLFQFRAVKRNRTGLPLLTFGHLTDFTHLVSGGPPRATIMVNNRLESVLYARPEEILAGIELPLTQRELSVLLLKQKGYRTKEIASTLRMKELSAYSLIRDIRKKTGMDILPLIRLLQEKGAIPT
ncbi:MAG: helix-turn-helix transcriptional regulator [Chitinophagaceae bacterium]